MVRKEDEAMVGLPITTIPSGKAALFIPDLNIGIKKGVISSNYYFFKRLSGIDGLINGWLYVWMEGGRIISFERPLNGIPSTKKN